MSLETTVDQPKISSSETQLQVWRENLLQTLLIALVVFGALVVITNIQAFQEQGNAWAIGFAITVYAAIIAITIMRNLSFTLRSHAFVWLNYGIVLFSYSLYGLNGDGRVWILYLVVLSTLLLGLRFGLFLAALNLATHGAIGALMNFYPGILPPPTQEVLDSISNLTSAGWITTGISLLFTLTLLTIPLGRLLNTLSESLKNLEDSLGSERKLTEELEEEQGRLERRSNTLERRVGQIRTAAEIASSLGAFLDPQELLDHVVNLVKERFDLYYVAIFLNDADNRFSLLSAGTGEAGRRMLEDGHKLSIGGTSMIGWSTANRKARIALDVGQEAIRFKNPNLPLTRSELALPISVGNNSLGAMSIQSTEPEAFDNNDIIILQSIADSLSIALDNARLFQQFEKSLQEIQYLNRQYLGEAWTNIVEDERDLTFTKDYMPDAPNVEVQQSRIPLTLRDDQVIGEITIESERTDWTVDEEEFISAVSTQAAIALESARLLEETQRNVERERALNQLTTQFSLSLDFNSLIQNVIGELGQLPKVVEASIHFSPPESFNGTNTNQTEDAT